MSDSDQMKDFFAPPPAEAPPSQAAAQSASEAQPATINDRFIAYLLDTGPFVLGYHLSLYWLVLHRPGLVLAGGFIPKWIAAWAGLYAFYHFIGNLSGGTVGKRIISIRVVAVSGASPGLVRSLIRALGNVLSTPLFNLGYLVALLHPQSRALHDLLSGCAVIEIRSKSSAEAWALFLAAFLSAGTMFGGTLFLTLNTPTPADLRAIESARQGLMILAQIQEKHKAAHGVYAESLEQLAQSSGDRDEFQDAITGLFDPHGFELKAGDLRYRIIGAARDHRRTKVMVEGP